MRQARRGHCTIRAAHSNAHDASRLFSHRRGLHRPGDDGPSGRHPGRRDQGSGGPCWPANTDWEGAVGLTLGYGPAYVGSDDYNIGLKPALYLRYGRFSLSSGAGFATRRADQVLRGLGVDLWSTERLRVSLAARLDNGRSESSSPALAGMGDVDGTLRARVSGTWKLDEAGKLGAAASIDALGRGQGTTGEVSFAREQPLTPDTVWTWGGSLTLRRLDLHAELLRRDAGASGEQRAIRSIRRRPDCATWRCRSGCVPS